MKITVLLFLCTSPILSKPNGRIIGGDDAIPGQFRALAAIYITSPQGQYFCAGSLVSKQWVLTAGHCVDGATLFTIHFNCLRLSDCNTNIVATESYVLHPDYNPETLANDLGLIKTREPVMMSNLVNPASLPKVDIVPTSEGVACGWGQTSDADAKLSDHLQRVTLTHVSDDECRITYGGQITDTMACFEGNYNEGTCIGDSGSPLMQFLNYKETLIAIATFFSSHGCESTDPSGFTRIFPYNDWIRNVTADVV